MCATARARYYAGIYTARPAGRARRMDACASNGRHRLQAQPLPAGHAPEPLGRGGATSAEYFPPAARDRARTTGSPSTRRQDLRVGQAITVGQCAGAPRPAVHEGSRCGPENVEAWGELKRGVHVARWPPASRCTAASSSSACWPCAAATSFSPDICVVGGVLEMTESRPGRDAIREHRAANPIGPLATAINACTSAPRADQLPHPRVPAAARSAYAFGTGNNESAPTDRPRAYYVKTLPAQGRLPGAAPDRPGWGVEMDEQPLGAEQVHPLGAQGAGQAGRVDRVRLSAQPGDCAVRCRCTKSSTSGNQVALGLGSPENVPSADDPRQAG